MAFLYIAEFFVMCVFVFFVGSQIVGPLVLGKPLFYSWRRAKIEGEVSEAQAELEIKQLKDAAEEIRRRVNPVEVNTNPVDKE